MRYAFKLNERAASVSLAVYRNDTNFAICQQDAGSTFNFGL